ncbi:MAG TPA: hypothetical protein ENJ31_02755, partial [Anaerolineae bacterium]|nr:hypothetical protein [Anaerolineae bacterium]
MHRCRRTQSQRPALWLRVVYLGVPLHSLVPFTMAMQMSTNGLKEQTLAEIRNIRDEYPDARSALLPALRLVQREYGWLPESAFDEVAAILDLPPTYVASVASFYTMFHQEPVGRHVIWVCTNISCSLLGAEHLLDYLSRKLGIAVGETTPDGRWTLLE